MCPGDETLPDRYPEKLLIDNAAQDLVALPRLCPPGIILQVLGTGIRDSRSGVQRSRSCKIGNPEGFQNLMI